VYVPLRDEQRDTTSVGLAFASDSSVSVVTTTTRVYADTLSMIRYTAISVERELDPTPAYVTALLNCPSQLLAVARGGRGSVDPRCNLR
jgi:hypothetical protein